MTSPPASEDAASRLCADQPQNERVPPARGPPGRRLAGQNIPAATRELAARGAGTLSARGRSEAEALRHAYETATAMGMLDGRANNGRRTRAREDAGVPGRGR